MAGAWEQLAQVFESPCLPACNDAMLTAVHDAEGDILSYFSFALTVVAL